MNAAGFVAAWAREKDVQLAIAREGRVLPVSACSPSASTRCS